MLLSSQGVWCLVQPQSRDYITEFVSIAPKTYAYQTLKGKVCVKAKGFTLCGVAENIITLDAMKDILYRSVKSGKVEEVLLQYKVTSKDDEGNASG